MEGEESRRPAPGARVIRRVRRPHPWPGPDAAAHLAARVDYLAGLLERWNLGDYVALARHPWRLVWWNFLGGIARGFGIAVGFALLTALVVRALQWTMIRNIPVLGQFIAEVVRLVQLNLR